MYVLIAEDREKQMSSSQLDLRRSSRWMLPTLNTGAALEKEQEEEEKEEEEMEHDEDEDDQEEELIQRI